MSNREIFRKMIGLMSTYDLIKFTSKLDNVDVNHRYKFVKFSINQIKFQFGLSGEILLFKPYNSFCFPVNYITKDFVIIYLNTLENAKGYETYMNMMKLYINIANSLDNLEIPYIERNNMRADMHDIASKLDGYYKTKEYEKLMIESLKSL